MTFCKDLPKELSDSSRKLVCFRKKLVAAFQPFSSLFQVSDEEGNDKLLVLAVASLGQFSVSHVF